MKIKNRIKNTIKIRITIKMKMTNRSDEGSSCTSPRPHEPAARLAHHDARDAGPTPG